MENYWRWKIQGGRKRMKTDAVPTLNKRTKLSTENEENFPDESLSQIRNPNRNVFIIPQKKYYSDMSISVKPATEHKAIQCRSVNSKNCGTSTPLREFCTRGCSPAFNEKVGGKITVRTFIKSDSEAMSVISTSLNSSTSDDYDLPSSVTPSDTDDNEVHDALVHQMQALALKVNTHLLSIKPVFYLGLGKDCYFVINTMQQLINCPVNHIYIVLKRIRTNRTFAELSDDFGMSESHLSRVFSRSLPLVYILMKTLINTHEREKVKLLLHIPFRARYSKVHFIIDCLEIEIQKPGNPVKQALTWSEYKKCNTIKYLIASTPNGVVNFISEGYGGRSTDAFIVEHSGFLEKLIPNTAVMADRGFKNIEYLLIQRRCVLVRPPSVATGVKSTKEEVTETRRIASLRIHVERVIRRL
ncbi:hypothetical protein Zmor_017664 [Zophobas morio]|uniref:DDE Tnp4 domain-containing protein n=1 Tax=Zophobas morio TaxID=2755281 RepID=A0AA38MCY7_9CUCU|nr:hypothetical protein Zmor_017664 [Zophobas morio]